MEEISFTFTKNGKNTLKIMNDSAEILQFFAYTIYKNEKVSNLDFSALLLHNIEAI